MKQSLPYKNGNTLSYTDFGDPNGYPILIQHGLIATIEDYDIFDQLVQLNTRLIAIARPGYGESSPYVMSSFGEWGEVVSALVDKLSLTQFDVLGISSGAPYGYALTRKFPNKVRNLYIFSGIPALYDAQVAANWPFPIAKDATIAAMQKLAHEIFFSKLSAEDYKQKDIQDSTRNNGFGIAQDLRLRGMDWGLKLSEIQQKVFMRHSRFDQSVPYATATLTAALLPNCTLDTKEDDVHFSKEALDEFVETRMAGWYGN